MTRLSAADRQWVLAFHRIFASIWVGAALCRALITVTCRPFTGEELYAVHLFLTRLDQLLIVPAAVSLLFTAFVIARMTGGELSRSEHVGSMWPLLITLLALDVVFLGPWTIYLFKLVDAQGMVALQNPTYAYYHALLILFGAAQCAGLLAVTVLLRHKSGERRNPAFPRPYWKMAQSALKS